VNITSSWNTAVDATNTISGTSMAAPHVTGVAALALAANPVASPEAVAEFITSNATAGRLTSLNTGSPNRLAYSVAVGAPTEPPPVFVAVRSLVGQAAKSGRDWKGQVTVSVRNVNTGSSVAGASVTGSFAPGGPASCTTALNGSCTLLSQVLAFTTGSTVFTVGNIEGARMVYDSTQNSASQLTIIRR
jgi:subtilisin family serine protease